MIFRYLNIENIKKIINPKKVNTPKSPERREFIKTMGFGVLAANPIVETLNSYTNKSFDISYDKNSFSVIRDGKIVWEINPNYFGENIIIHVKKSKNNIFLRAKNLKVVQTHLEFDLEANINKKDSDWIFNLKIPQFELNKKLDFIEWIDGYKPINTNLALNKEIVNLNQKNTINLHGNFDCKITSKWDFTFKKREGIITKFDNTILISDAIYITQDQGELDTVISNSLQNGVKIVIEGKNNWETLMQSIQLDEAHSIKTLGDAPDLNFSLGITDNNKLFKALWVSEQKGSLTYSNIAEATEGILFNKYFYLADLSGSRKPKFYLSAKMPDSEQWLTNSIGSFYINSDSDEAELELFGTGNLVTNSRLEPRFKAFQPRIEGAFGLPTFLEDEKIDLSAFAVSQQKTKKLKKEKTSSAKSIKTPKPALSTFTEKVEFSSAAPIKIKVLRPEDMVYLEFEFHNFKFVGSTNLSVISPTKPIEVVKPLSNKITTIKKENPKKTLTTATLLVKTNFSEIELNDKEKKGTVIIYFPTQHTLEQAFFEGSSSESVKIPAKHLRAKKSRLVYELEAGKNGFVLSMDELLDWSKFKLKVDRRAWISLENINVLNKPTYIIPNKLLDQNRELPANTNFISKKDKNYGLKLAQNTKVIAQKIAVYEEVNLKKVLISTEATTLNPSFNIVSILKSKVEPISEMYTSIEAPALLYISPNQINDFKHKIALDLQKTITHKTSKDGVNSKFFKKSTDLKITPVVSKNIDKIGITNTAAGEIAELWHTHLGVKMKDGSISNQLSKLKTIRALWAFEAKEKVDGYTAQGDKPFRASINGEQRHQLVHLTSNYNLPNLTPQPVQVKKLILSNLGAYLDWHTHFKIPATINSLDLIEWGHLATLGRDHFVKIVQEGYLFPFGHKAAVVTITERKFDKSTKAAVNKQLKYIVILENIVTYERVDSLNKFIKFPFQEVKINNKQTPDIDNPGDASLIDNSVKNFLINVGGKGYPFDLSLTDKEGIIQHVRMALGFIEKSVALKTNTTLLKEAIKTYHEDYVAYTNVALNGQEIAYAESFVGGDTLFETESIQFGAKIYPAKGADTLKFHPIMRSSKVFIEAVDKITNSRKPVEIYLEDDNNPGDIFASVLDTFVDFSGGSGSSGGFITPNMSITALSKLEGAIGGKLDELKELKFSPASVFGNVDDVGNSIDTDRLDDLPLGKIFGVISLASLLLNIDLNTNELKNDLEEFKAKVKEIKEKIEALKNKILYYENLAKQSIEDIEEEFSNIRNLVNTDIQAEIDAYIQREIDLVKEEIKKEVANLINKLAERTPKIPNLKTYVTDTAFFAEYKYQPDFKGANNKPIVVFPNLLKVEVGDKKKALSITTILKKPFELGESPSLKTLARFDNFAIDIVPLLKFKFKYLEFKSGSNSKTDVKIEMDANDPIQFKGALSFVNNLQSIIPNTGFSKDGPYIDLQPTGVKCGFNISVPNVEVGICMITNISLGAYAMLPFTGAPLTMGFNFCTRENPFLLTISAFGGGGYFMMITTLEGIQSLEAAFEFGAAMSLNVGVASGSVSVMGGFYFKMELVEVDGNEVSNVALSGYLRMNGRLSILGMITVSIEFYLALNAVIVNGKVQKMEGTATVKVKVEVLFFSKTVSVTVRRELKGADADPKFIEMIEEDDWQTYCLAFAS
ncbi:hypothetical protein MHL31_09610 [Lutibacter sp. A80]|uniref:hypothetical protein n=1 Tax=Lutibacter sp. A80 TaxID=2918453 RepID=UPI001F05B91F|nr:hypothetical protein [Lutibacter sp. A80]UMB59336.1 hypothetical protein MHL31_09610 [Lutibacter sp. A80]